MPRGYRRYILTALGCLILGVAPVLAVEPTRVPESQGAKQRHQPASAYRRPAQGQRSTPDTRAIQEKKDAERARQREDASDKREADDLIEQRRAADAATRAANAAQVQTWIAGIGIVLILGTMWAQIGATKAATKAVEAQLAIERGRVTVSLHDKVFLVLGDAARFDFVLNNSGKTEAILIAYAAELMPTDSYERFMKRYFRPTKDSRVITSGKAGAVFLKEVKFATATSHKRYIGCHFAYRTAIDDREFSTTFCIRLGGVDPDNPQTIKWSFAENDEDWPGVQEDKPPNWYDLLLQGLKHWGALLRRARAR